MNYKLNTWYEMANGYDGEVVYIFIYFKDKNCIKYICAIFNETQGEPYELLDVNTIPEEFDGIFVEEEMESVKEVSERYIINANFS